MIEQWLVMGVLAVSVLSLALYALHLSRRLQQLQQQQAHELAALQEELQAFNRAAMGVGQQLIHTEKKLKAAVERQQQMTQAGDEALSYQQVVDMVQHGADSKAVMQRFGLSEAEARLLTLLNARTA